MADVMADRKRDIHALIDKWTPLAAHGVTLSLSFPGSRLCIKHKKPIIGTTKEFIEGLLCGAGLAPSYYPDGGPCNCQTPFIEWQGPERYVNTAKL